MKAPIIFYIGLILLFSFGTIEATEVIKNYESLIEIDSDGSLNVTEHITVNAEGKNIAQQQSDYQ